MNESTVRRRLDLIRIVAIVDALLLVPLVIAALNDAEGVVDWLGPPGSLIGDVKIRRDLP